MPDSPQRPQPSLLTVLAMLEPTEHDIGCPVTPLTAEDVLPIIAKLPSQERIRLRLMLLALDAEG